MLAKVHKNRGFTLIELMIALVIVSILASIAFPSYQQYVRSARRADAYASLLEIELQQEKHRVTNTAYSSSLSSLGVGSTTENGHYDLALSGVSATGYTATATAKGGQTDDTGCTSLTLTLSAGSISRAPSACWKK